MNKGYAFGFLIILLIVVLGFYVAFTGFTASRQAHRAQATPPPATEVAQASATPAGPTPTPTPTIVLLPTPIPGITATLTAAVPTATTEPQAGEPTQTTAPRPTQPPPTQPPPTATPQAQPPTATLVPRYQFRLESPPVADPGYPNCCYIYGTVRDAGGVPLEGVRVQAFNEWNQLPPAVTKGGGEAGQYNIPIGQDPVTWNLIIVDANGNQISTQVPVQFDPNVAGGYRVNWQRTY